MERGGEGRKGEGREGEGRGGDDLVIQVTSNQLLR